MIYRYYKGFKQQKWPSNSLKLKLTQGHCLIGSHAIW